MKNNVGGFHTRMVDGRLVSYIKYFINLQMAPDNQPFGAQSHLFLSLYYSASLPYADKETSD